MRPRHALRVTRDSARIAMDALPVRSQQFLDKRVRPHVSQVRTTVVDSVVRPVAVGGRARVRHASLLDGHTLNLYAVLPPHAAAEAGDGGAGGGAGGDEAFLCFVRGRRQLRVPVRLSRAGTGELHAEATVPLGPLPGGVDLEAGRWGLRIVLGGAGRTVRAFDLEGPLGPAAAGGPTQTPPASPLTGHRYQIRVTPLGLCRITVRRPQPHAEMVRLELRPEGAAVAFRMVGMTRARPVAVELACGSATVEVVPTAADGGGLLVFAVPLDAMLRRTDQEGAEHDWQIAVRMRDGSRHTLGRELDIPRMPRRVFRMPTRLVCTEEGALVRVRPHYNARHQIRLGCAAVAPAATDRTAAAHAAVAHARPGVTA